MSNERRHLRFLITSALLVGPALGCGDPEPDMVNTVAPVESQPTGNPVEPETEPAIEDPTGNPGEPEPGPEPIAVEPTEATEPAPGVNTNSRRQQHERRLQEQRERELSEGPIPTGPSVDDRPEAARTREE